MTQMDWTKADPGAAGFDEDLGDQWRRGPSGMDASFPDVESVVLSDKPTMDLGRKLSVVFGCESDSAHDRMASRAKRAASEVRGSYGLDGLKRRSRQFNERASTSKPWPTLWFAFYFDYFAGRLYRAARPEADKKKSRDRYFSNEMTEIRWHGHLIRLFGVDVLSEIRMRQNARSVAKGRPRAPLPGNIAPRGVRNPDLHDRYAAAHSGSLQAWKDYMKVSPEERDLSLVSIANRRLIAVRAEITAEVAEQFSQPRTVAPKTLNLSRPGP